MALEDYHRLPSQGMFVVRVGAHGSNPQYREFSGDNYYGPMTGDDAKTFELEVRTELANQFREGMRPVYGEIEIELIPMIPPRAVDLTSLWGSPARAARNWVGV